MALPSPYNLSNTYGFAQNTFIDDIIREILERIGLIGNVETGLLVQSAVMSMNLELSRWPGLGLNLWMVERQMLALYPNQPIYSLPANTIRIIDVVASAPVRYNLGGVATSSATSSGTAGNCFNPAATQGCTLVPSANSYIQYSYPPIQPYPSIFYVGILPLSQGMYSINVQLSFDNVNWIDALISPTQMYYPTQTNWLVVQNCANAQYWRIFERTTTTALAIQQIYFSVPSSNGSGDRTLSPLSRQDWIDIPNKFIGNSFPSGYYFDQSLNPTIILYPVPSATYPTLLYTSYRSCQDIASLSQNVDIPVSFYDALISATAYRMAQKFAPDRVGMLKADADEAYRLAGQTNFENVPLNINPTLSGAGN